MTVSSSTAKAGPYAGAGLPGPFTVPFRFLSASHLQLIRTSTAGIDTELVLTTDYTVAGVGAASGSVTLTAPLASGERLTIVRDVPFTQLADYVNNDAFPAESHEDALDLLTMQTQQLKERVDSALTLPPTVTGASGELPSPEPNKLIGWNEAGDALQNMDATTLATIVAFGTSRADTFTGNGVQTQFALTANPGALANLDVSIGGVVQTPGVNYTFSGTTLTFSTAPPLGVGILARYFLALPQGVTDSAASMFLQAGAGAVTRTVEGKLRDVVNVNDFGADPTGVIGSASAIQAALNSGAGHVVARGTYLINADLLLPDEVLFDCRGSILRASANNRTIIKSAGGPNSYFSQIWGGIWDGNGRTGVVGMDLSNMRIGAGVFSPVWRDMAVGLIARNGCFGMVIDHPGSLRVPAPIQVLANASTMVVRNPSFDNGSGVGGNDVGIGIDIRFGAGDNIGVRVEGGYVQGFATGILDAGIKTIIENVYFELCSVADVDAAAARAGHYKTNTHYGPSGPAGYRLKNSDAVIIDDPTMASGARTRLFDADGTNTNCVARMAGSNASLNAPLGITTGLMLTDYTTFYTATDASGAGLTFVANRQGYRSGHGLRVTIDVDITYPTTSSTANAAITLPVPARSGALVSGACGFTDYGGFVGIAGSGSTINFFSAAGGGLTNANLSGRRLQFSLSYVTQ